MPAFGPAGGRFEPEIRCDKPAAQNEPDGCVMPDAAAVLVLNSAAGDVVESAIHIRESQTVIQPGMTDFAPGKYSPLLGTRAVAEFRTDLPYSPLQYTRSERSRTLNYRASCADNQTSLVNTRPYSGSPTCPTYKIPRRCQCDEFPYKSTTNGAATNPGTTSVRIISAEHNEEAGRQYGKFLVDQRVLPQGTTANYDPFWVYVK